MGIETGIQWTDATYNAWRGCTKYSPGCTNCYADAQAKRNPKVLGYWGPNGPRVMGGVDSQNVPFKLALRSNREGVRKRLFVNSFADFFEEYSGRVVAPHGGELVVDKRGDIKVPHAPTHGTRPLHLDDLREHVLGEIARFEGIDFQILTKRPHAILGTLQRIAGRTGPAISEAGRAVARAWIAGDPPPNCWLGVSVESNAYLYRLDQLAAVPAACRFMSAEPLLGELFDLPLYVKPAVEKDRGFGYYQHLATCSWTAGGGECGYACNGDGYPGTPDFVNWVVVGGESGHKARPCNREWVEAIVNVCTDNGVPVFVKQLGQKAVGDDGELLQLRHKKGGEMDEWPAFLRVREFPEVDGTVNPWELTSTG